jgi:hypothetical protein
MFCKVWKKDCHKMQDGRETVKKASRIRKTEVKIVTRQRPKHAGRKGSEGENGKN